MVEKYAIMEAICLPREVGLIIFFISNYSISHVLRKHSDFEMKTLKSEKGYRDNLTSFKGFSAKI